MEKQPLISIIIPVYNIFEYISQCLDSVIRQSYINIEILLIDDDSTDGAGEICNQYSLSDERIKVYHIKHGGLSVARNVGLVHAKGDYIAFLDSDDWIEPNTIELFVKYALKYDADIVACRAYHEWVNKTVPSKMPSEFAIYNREVACKELICYNHLGQGVWNKLYRADLFKEIRFPEGRIYEDIATTYRLLERAEKVVWIPDMLFHYRMRESSICHTVSLKNDKDRWYAYYEIYAVWSGKGKQFREKLNQICFSELYRIWFLYPKYIEETESSEQERIKELFHELCVFSKSHRREILRGDYPIKTKVLCFLSQCDNPVYLSILGRMNTVRKVFRKQPVDTKVMFP